jgi:glycosyltransferase involved in cell wall biosynthesis
MTTMTNRSAPPIAIVMPVFNGQPYLADAIESALAQTSPAEQIIILNDASTDDTAATIDRYRGHPLVRIETLTERLIAPAAWNYAVRLCSCPYFVILAHDDRLHPDFLAQTGAVLAKSPETGFVLTGYTVINSSGQNIEDRPITRAGLLGPTPFEALFQEMVVDAGMYFCDTGTVVARSAFDAIGGFDERFRGGVYDYDFYLRLSAATPTFALGQCLVDYRIHASNMSADLHRDDKGDADVLFAKIPNLTGLNDWQKRQLARNLWAFEFNHFTRAVRAPNATVKDMRLAREMVAARLARWMTSGSPFAAEVQTSPPRLRTRLAWWLGRWSIGLRLMHAAANLVQDRGGWK